MDEDDGSASAETVETEGAVEAETPPEDDLQRVRELILQAHPNVVPELIGGTTIDELLSSVTPAREAFTRLSERIATIQPRPADSPRVPAGSPVRTTGINADSLSPVSKIRMGLGRDA